MTAALGVLGTLSLLAGIEAGASITKTQSVLTPHFRAGGGLDALFGCGLLAEARIDATQEIDTTFAMGLGWAGEAMRTDQGFPLAFTAGGALAIDHLGSLRGGARASVVLSLWYSRATLALDGAMLESLTQHARFLRGTAPEVAVGLTIRFVPWNPWTL